MCHEITWLQPGGLLHFIFEDGKELSVIYVYDEDVIYPSVTWKLLEDMQIIWQRQDDLNAR